jgi:hypothetical protein
MVAWHRPGEGAARVEPCSLGSLAGTIEIGLDRRTSWATGDLCQASKTADVVDAHIALLTRDGDVVLTSDTNDLRPRISKGSIPTPPCSRPSRFSRVGEDQIERVRIGGCGRLALGSR